MSETNGHSVSYSGGTPEPQVPLPQTEAQVEEALTGEPMALGYRATMPILSYYGAGGVPVLNQTLWADVELMLTHPSVSGPLSYYKAGIANVEFEVKCQRAEVAEFIQKMLRRFWERSLAQVQRSYEYGWMAAEICYRSEEGRLCYESLFDFHPLDVYALTDRNRYCGVSVHNVVGASGTGLYGGAQGALRLWGPYRFPAKAFWFAHNKRYQRFYGQSQLYAAWRPWRRLAFRDGLEESLDGGVYRFLYGGWQVYYPPEDFPKQDGGIDYTAARNMARQFAEQAKSGAGLAVPNSRDEKGNRKWEFVRPEILMNFDPALNIVKYLKDEISYGIGVPPELLQAAETGSGWSGRKVPLIGFYTTQLGNARAIVASWKVQIGDPLVHWNFGPGIHYEIEVKLVLPPELAGQGDNGSMMGGSGEQHGPQPAQPKPPLPPGLPAPQAGQGVQMGADDESIPLAQRVERAAQETDPNPSEAQKQSGNYKKGRVVIQGLPVVIENARGSTRSGTDQDGKPWSVTMAHHYGYVGRSKSEADGDAVDVFVGPNPESEIVYVINQKKPDGAFDEHKAMLGFHSEEEARQGYLACYSPGWQGLGAVTPLTMRQFKGWLKEGQTGEPTPGQTITLSLLDEGPSDELASDAAEDVLAEAFAAFAKLARRVRRELLALAKRGPLSAVLARARKLLDKVRPDLVRLLTDTQLAAVLAGMRQVGRRVQSEAKNAGEPTSPALLAPSWFGDDSSVALPAAEKPSVALPLIDEAVRDLRQRRLLTRTQYDQLAAEARMKAFTVAGVETEELLDKIRAALADAVAEGATLEDFHGALQTMTESGSVLAPARAETVFRKHVQEGYSNGQDRLLEHPLIDEIFPFAAVYCIHDDRVRPEHKAMETRGIQGTNIYYRADPVFQLFKGPWDWNCRCGWTALSVRDAAQRGIEEAKKWLETGQRPLRPTFVEMPPWRPSPEFRRLELSTDAEGHEHSARDGRFVSKGQSASKGQEASTAKAPAKGKETAKDLKAAVVELKKTPEGRRKLARAKAVIKKAKESIQVGARAALESANQHGAITLLGAGVDLRSPTALAKGAAILAGAVSTSVHDYLFSTALSQHFISGASMIGTVGAQLAARGEILLFKALAGLWRKTLHRLTHLGPGEEHAPLGAADRHLLAALARIAEKALADTYRQAGLPVPPLSRKKLARSILAALRQGKGAELGTDTEGDSLDPRQLAEAYAELWNGQESHGEPVREEDLLAADSELCGSDWHVVKVGNWPWIVLHARSLEGFELATERAPKGGVVIHGKFYRGGLFIPSAVVAEMTPEEKHKLHAAQQAAHQKRAARGNVDVDALRARLGEHGHDMTPRDLQTARKSFHALHAFHGALTLHRLEELEEKTRALLKRPGVEGSMLGRQLRRRLGWYHAMIDYAESRGVTGKVPADILTTKGAMHGDELEGHGGRGAGGGLPAGQPVGEGTPPATATDTAEPAAGAGTGRRTRRLPAGPDGGRDASRGSAARTGDATGHGAGAGPETASGQGARAAVLHEPATPQTPTDLSAGNFRYQGTDFVPRGLMTKYRANIAAIRTLKEIQAEGRTTATPAEQEILSQYTGWGQFPGIFNDYGDEGFDWAEHNKWGKEREELKGLISDDEWQAARRSTLNAHYTHPDVVQAQWQMAQRLGYQGGRFLETSAGIGYYLGQMPTHLAARTHGTAVELDKLTGGMLGLLYPKTNVRVTGFEKFSTPNNFYDLVASNVPFGDYRVNDPKYNKHKAFIHDYFFLKSADVVRPGGLVMHVTSSGTMDKGDPKIRQLLADKMELVSAIRFPGGAHKENAGTEVVTDLLILRKKDPAMPPVDPSVTPAEAQPKEPGFTGVTTDSLGRLYHWVDGKRVPAPDWISTTTVPDPAGGEPIPVNRYFADHPEQVLGTIDRTGTMRARDTKNVSRPEDYAERLQAAIDRLPEGIMHYHKAPAERFAPEVMPAPGQTREGGYAIHGGKLYTNEQGQLVEQKVNAKDLARVEGQLQIRDAVRALFNAQLKGEDTTALRKHLGDVYDAYVKEHGLLNDPANRRAFRTDPDSPVLLALENYDPKAKTATKSDIFHKDTIRPNQPVEKAGTVTEALGVSLHEAGRVNVEHMARLTGRSPEAIGKELVAQGLAYHDPEEGWKPADQYLSGNVRRKLLMARAAAAADPAYQPNVQALEKVQPDDIDHEEIDVRLGASWVPPSDIKEFAASLLQGQARDFEIHYLPATGEWQADFSRRGEHLAGRQLAREVWATPRKDFATLFEAALNNRSVKVYDRDADDKAIINQQATEDANAKIQEMKAAFADWIWQDEERTQRLHRYYNDNFNNIRNIRYNGQHLTFPGMNPAIQLRPHQKDFVWQVISTGKGLAAHEVGTGKTYTMIAAAMEMRRMGLCKKPCITTPKATVGTITRAALELYPGVRILSTEDMFDAASRKKTIAQIATGDYDLIVMTHDHLDMLNMKPETVSNYINEEIEELEAAKLARMEEGGAKKNDSVVKALDKAKARLEAKLAEALDDSKKDDAVFFEETGIDHLMVDESQDYKALPVYTKQDRVKGIATRRSDRATAMQMRTRWLMENNGGRGVVFATGTPITNAMTEMYTLQRYLQDKDLKERNIRAFDAWASTFGDVVTKNEFTETGDYKPISRFASFVNIPELMQMAYQFMDVQRADDLQNTRQFGSEKAALAHARDLMGEGGERATREHMEARGITVTKQGDGYTVTSPSIVRPRRIDHGIAAPRSEALGAYMERLKARAEALKQARPEKGADNMLVVCTDGRKAAVDMRLVDASAPDDPASKANLMIANVLKLHQEKPGMTQLIFSDVGVNPVQNGFHLYQDLIDKLVQGGIPREKIADFSKLEGKKKEEAMAAMRRGEVLVGIGGTQKLGTGVNVQDRLHALHHLDVPHRPSDLEQRDGRGWRQGNENKDVHIYRYVTEGSVDQTFWQRIANKTHFIGQVVRPLDKGALTRVARDEDTEEMSADEFIALSSGDPRVKEKVDLADEVKQLKSAKSRHEREQAKLQQSVKATEAQIPHLERKLAGMKDDQKTLADHPDFSLTIDGKTYDDRKEAAEAFQKKAEAIGGTYRPTLIGDYRGLEVYRHGQNYFLKGEGGEYTTGPTLNSVESIARFQPRRIEEMTGDIAAKRSDLEKTRQSLGKKFTRDAELAEKSQRLQDLEEELKNANKKEEEGGQEAALPRTFRGSKEAAEELQSIRNEMARPIEARPDMAELKARIDAVGKWAAQQKKQTPSLQKILEEAHSLADRTEGGTGAHGVRIRMNRPPSPRIVRLAAELVSGYADSQDKAAANRAFKKLIADHDLSEDDQEKLIGEFRRQAKEQGFTLSTYHGPVAPGPDWVLVGEGPRGGKIWNFQGKAAPQQKPGFFRRFFGKKPAPAPAEKGPVQTTPTTQKEIRQRMEHSPAHHALAQAVAKNSEGAYTYLAHQAGVSVEEMKAHVAKKAQNIVNNSDVYLRVKRNVLPLILQSGRFLNQHETGSSQALYDPQKRRQVEAESMGIEPSEHAASRPIYGYLAGKNFSTLQKDGLDDHESTEAYGGVIVRMKDHVKERGTVSFGDSWELQSARIGVASPMGAVSHLSVPAQAVASSGGKILDSSVAWGKARMPYIEAQIHDGLTTDDIAEIRFREGTEISPELQAALKQRGIQWSTYA